MRYTVIAVVFMALTACSGSGARPAPATPAPAASTTPVTFGGIPGSAERQACHGDVEAVQAASDAYAAQNGRPAASVAALVAAGLLREAPATGHGYNIDYDATTGKVSAQGACAS
jgi:hypothetical protein